LQANPDVRLGIVHIQDDDVWNRMDWTCHPISFDPQQPHLALVEIVEPFSVVLGPSLHQDLKLGSGTGLWSPSPEWQECLTGPESTLAKTAELMHRFCSYLLNTCIISLV